MKSALIDIERVRARFPALSQSVAGDRAVFFDGPAGTQVPQSVIDAISQYLIRCNANHGGQFATSQATDQCVNEVHVAVADFLGTSDPETVVFGPNMTSLTFALSRALGRRWTAGDEVVVSKSEHDANFTPWVLMARDAGMTVRYIDLDPADCTLDLDSLRNVLSSRTKLVAVGAASNATGTRHPVAEICRLAREAGALSFVDAVHFAPHDLLDVSQLGCDFLACSAYKFFGPHQGILWGRRELLETVEPYKLRPAPDLLPGKWMTGTQNHACLAGTQAAVDYLASLGQSSGGLRELTRREALRQAFLAIVPYEQRLVWELIDGLQQVPNLKIWGITDRRRAAERMPTVVFTHPQMASLEIARTLGTQGFCVWHGNYYALPLTEQLGVEPHGMVRVGIVHYNSSDEVTRLVHAVHQLFAQ